MIKPILFNTDMVRAIQANIKTATRRPVRPRYCDSVFEMFRDELCEASPYKPPRNNGDGTTTRFVRQFVPCKPPYRPGDILYVRETWRRQPLKWSREGGYSDFVLQYRADFTDEEDDCYGRRGGIMPQKWRPSIHMPREAARIFLRVTDVRVERLQEMTDEDIVRDFNLPEDVLRVLGRDCIARTVWDSTIKKANRALYGWEADP